MAHWSCQEATADEWAVSPAGSEPGAGSREREVQGSRESRSRKATLPDQGQDGECWSYLGHGSCTVALSMGRCGELGGSWPLMVSPQTSVSSSVKWQ